MKPYSTESHISDIENLRGRERDINFKDDLVSTESGVSRGVRVRVIQLGGGRGQSPAENKINFESGKSKQESRNEAGNLSLK